MMAPRHPLVMDASILVSSVLGEKVRPELSGNARRCTLFAPEDAYATAWRLLPELLEARGVDPGAGFAGLTLLQPLVGSVPRAIYAPARAEAMGRLGPQGTLDWPVLALALTLHCPVWTHDRHFLDAGVPTWTTERVQLYLSNVGGLGGLTPS